MPVNLRISSGSFLSTARLLFEVLTLSLIPINTYEGHGQNSYILQIPDSDSVRDRVEYRKRRYPKTPIAQRTHYVIPGHDIYHEILAVSFTASTIPKVEVTESSSLLSSPRSEFMRLSAN
jgi:hypothetical protein